MRFGFALPQAGSAIGPEGLITAAKRAEDLGFDSLWVLDRILWPVNPRVPYPIGDGSLPVKYKSVLDPLETLVNLLPSAFFLSRKNPLPYMPNKRRSRFDWTLTNPLRGRSAVN